MPCAGNHPQLASAQVPEKPLLRPVGDDPVGSRLQDQRRYARIRRFAIKRRDGGIGGGKPAIGQADNGQPRIMLDQRQGAVEPAPVTGQPVALEPAPSGSDGDQASRQAEGDREPDQQPQHPAANPVGQDVDHRREQDQPVGVDPVRRTQGQVSPHGMPHQEQAPAIAHRKPACPQDAVEICQEVIHRLDMDQPAVGERTVRQPLPAPVQAEHLVPARLQLADRLQVLLDELAEAREQDGPRPPRTAKARRKDGIAQPGPVMRGPAVLDASVIADRGNAKRGRGARGHDASTTAQSSAQSSTTSVPGPGSRSAVRAALARDTLTSPSGPAMQRTR